MIRIDDFPELKLLCWSANGLELLTDAEAFAIYERNWRYIDQSKLTSSELALIQRLTRELGRGVMNV